MAKPTTVEAYIEKHPKWSKGLMKLASIISQLDLQATIKWSAPVYTYNGKNVIGLGAFKHHFGIWFFNGVFLSDPQNLLVNAQENKTKALRQMRFTSNEHIDTDVIKHYILEAIDNEKKGKRLAAKPKPIESIEVPELLLNALNKNHLQDDFTKLSPYKQKEYIEYISTAKRDSTKLSRLHKILPMIAKGQGLNDKYRT